MTFHLHGPFAPINRMCLVFHFSFEGRFFYPARPTVGVSKYAYVACVITLKELYATENWRHLMRQKLEACAASIVDLKQRAARGQGFHRRRKYRTVHHIVWL